MSDAAQPPVRHPWTEQDYEELTAIFNAERVRLTNFVRQIAPSVDHDNVVGAAMLALFLQWNTIEGKKVKWLYKVARNKAVDALRDRDFGHEPVDECAELVNVAHLVWAPPRPGETLLFLEAVGELPRRLGLPLTLFQKGWTHAEIAEYMGLSVETIKTYLSKARNHLIAKLRAAHHEDDTSEGTSR
ncbi:RNA polymerase sigma factor [Amycolatopsis sp. NPDC059021]|uniref:RNA polymerase sigma factor n=1 Tax=Amycolatopsis sp. NPDC059021 TaxID=3346704 RepID=UPI00366E1989